MLKTYNTFEIDKYIYDFDTNILKLVYNIDDFQFIEEINFNPNSKKLKLLNDDEKKGLDLAFSYLHIVAGVSYYKAFIPQNIKINTIKLNKEQKIFFDKLYLHGLGEFSYKNKISLKNRINFPYEKNVKNESIELKLNDEYIIPIGGGKNSIVTFEIMKNTNKKIYTFAINPTSSINDCLNNIKCNSIIIKRTISPNLLKINKELKKYNAYNGHVPITAIIAFISVVASIIYNFNTTIISNEKSSNTGNIMYDGFLVNHQWSKSFEAEKMINEFIKKYIVKSFNYFSLLRPIYEIHIASIFAKMNKYFSFFSSCNKNFKLNKKDNERIWCCDCDKCRFVFLILSSFFKKKEIINIFGKNLLDDEKQLDGYLELTGFLNNKPFECVGEIEEFILSFYLLSYTEFKDDFIVKKINQKIFKKYDKNELENFKKKYFSIDFDNTLLNDEFKKILLNFLKDNGK